MVLDDEDDRDGTDGPDVDPDELDERAVASLEVTGVVMRTAVLLDVATGLPVPPEDGRRRVRLEVVLAGTPAVVPDLVLAPGDTIEGTPDRAVTCAEVPRPTDRIAWSPARSERLVVAVSVGRGVREERLPLGGAQGSAWPGRATPGRRCRWGRPRRGRPPRGTWSSCCMTRGRRPTRWCSPADGYPGARGTTLASAPVDAWWARAAALACG